jgi:hypothetical protein
MQSAQGLLEFVRTLGAPPIAAMTAVTLAFVGFSPSSSCALPHRK